MKKENDEITDLFRTQLSNMEMTVRDGFWEGLERDIPVASQNRRRLIFFRVAAAASVLLVLAASSATFWYFSPKEEMEEAFTKIVAENGGRLDGDGVRVNQLPTAMNPVLPKPSPKPYGLQSRLQDDDSDSVSISFSMSFSFSTTTSKRNSNGYAAQERNNYWQANSNSGEQATNSGETVVTTQPLQTKMPKKHRWALKAQVGTALPAESGTYKMPVSVGLTIERKLNDYLGIETGLMYSNLSSTGQHLHYLGIPLKANVTFLKTKKIDLYATVGGIIDKCVAGAPDNGFNEEPVQLAATAGMGITYKINDRLAVFAEPGVTHHFKTDSKLATVRTKRPTNFNLLCGLRMTY